jgi:hypothetical protein
MHFPSKDSPKLQYNFEEQKNLILPLDIAIRCIIKKPITFQNRAHVYDAKYPMNDRSKKFGHIVYGCRHESQKVNEKTK